MKCKKYEMTASAYIDRQLAEEEETEYRSHLGMCADCRSYLTELREVSLLVSGVSQSDAPGELHSYIISAVKRSGASQAASPARVYEWLLKMNPLPISYLTGAFVSVCLFAFVLSGFRPIPVIGADGKQMIAIPVTTGPIVTGSEPEFNSYNNLPPNAAASGNEHYYELPRVIDNGSLVSFSHIAYERVGSDGMSALVEVSPDGHAELVEVLDEPHDPVLVEQLWWSLSRRTFQPARVEGRAVSTRIVLVVEKVDVGG